MKKNILFEHHLKEKVMEIIFPDGFEIHSAESIDTLKTQWSENLKKWHSPYSCLMDCRKLSIDSQMAEDFEKLVQFFLKFFMKKIIGFSDDMSTNSHFLPFEVIAPYDNALVSLGMGKGFGGLERDLTKLRSRIHIDNDFNAHVMEISFLAKTDLLTAGDVTILKSKIQNALLQWHTPYSILFNTNDLTFSDEAIEAFAQFEKFLKSFFCQKIIGYGSGLNSNFPFKVFRARHQAASQLTHQGLSSGEIANCSTKKILSK